MHMLMVFLNIDLSAANGTKLSRGPTNRPSKIFFFWSKRKLDKHCSHLFNAQISTILLNCKLIDWLTISKHGKHTCCKRPSYQIWLDRWDPSNNPSHLVARWATLQKVGWAAHDDDHMDLTCHHKIIMGEPSCMCIDHSTLTPCMGFLATSFPAHRAAASFPTWC